jgi:hypothetical protein
MGAYRRGLSPWVRLPSTLRRQLWRAPDATKLGMYRLETLIARHGADFGIPDLLRLLSDDCPKRKSVTIYDRCGVHCPELPGFFLGEED